MYLQPYESGRDYERKLLDILVHYSAPDVIGFRPAPNIHTQDDIFLRGALPFQADTHSVLPHETTKVTESIRGIGSSSDGPSSVPTQKHLRDHLKFSKESSEASSMVKPKKARLTDSLKKLLNIDKDAQKIPPVIKHGSTKSPLPSNPPRNHDTSKRSALPH